MSNINNNYYFLEGGGEMGKLIREKDWSKTPLGSPSTWPQSLRTMVSVMLDNPFGMYIAWGPEYTQLYNDGYRPILGSIKHPEALGISTRETFSEIWHTIDSMFDGVMKGKAVGFPDFMLPLNRNGFVEECYFDFSYSPIRIENGEVGGVLVTVIETTEKKKANELFKENNLRYKNNIMQAPVAICIFRGENHVVEIANEKMLEIWGAQAEQVLNKPIFIALPESKDQGLEDLLSNVFTSGKKIVVSERLIQLNRNGQIETLYVDFVCEALRESDGTISGIITIATEVTTKVKSRSRLIESEHKVRALVENAPFPIALYVGKEMIIELANQSIIDVWGKGNDVIGKSFKEVLPELDNQLVFEQIAKVYSTGEAFHTKNTPLDLIVDGKLSTYYFNYSLTPLYDIDGNVYGVMNTGVDLTDLNLAKKSIEESEQKFRLLANSMPQHIWTSDPEGNLNYFNQSVYDYTGLTAIQISKDGWLQIVHPDDREENMKVWLNSIATGKDFLLEHRFKRHDGEYRWQLSRAIPQIDANGKIQMWVGTSTDIQDQRIFTNKLEKKVADRTQELNLLNEYFKKSEERYHLMVEEVQDYAILYLNHLGIIENWNLGAEKIKGYTEKEILGKNFSVFYTEDDQKINLPQKLLALARNEGKAVQEGWRVRKDGTLFWASVVITAVHNAKKEVIGFSKVTHNLTEKKKADDQLKLYAQELQQKNVDLDKMNKELQSFTYISSHDLQEPLRKIQTFATQILEKESQNLSENGKDKFQRMYNSAQRMQILIDDLLAYSRTNTMERVFEKVDLKEIINEVKSDMKEELELNQVTIETHELCEVKIIHFQFRQLLYNLISNSIKFAKQNIPAHINISCKIGKGEIFSNNNLEKELKYCHISISDNGIGFEEQYNKKIFEVFQRLHGRSAYIGTGIGLAIVKKIIDNHFGIITASGEPSKGATFDIYIPAF